MLEGDASTWSEAVAAIRGAFTARAASAESPPFQGGWIGWLGYELARAFDLDPGALPNPIGLPDYSLALYDWSVCWDHQQGAAWLISTGVNEAGAWDATRARQRADQVLSLLSGDVVPESPPASGGTAGLLEAATPAIGFDIAPPGLAADFSPEEFQGKIAEVVEAILDGAIFQANLTLRFTAPWRGSPLRLLAELRRRTSAPMTAYLRHPEATVLSMSPERFLRYLPSTRRVETWPIKGTRPRDPDPVRDEALARELAASGKDRAENVMIVDLLRNDLSRVAVAGSVQVPALCRVESHPTVHHLVSEIVAELRSECDALDLIAAAFPGGSITGAPKRRAMEIIAERERVARGIYTGAILRLGLDGAMDSSIAIRTMILSGGVATLHAGGGITALSDPREEYQECLTKASALVAALEAVE